MLNRIFILAISLILVSCSSKSTPESEALLNEIQSTQSKIKVGINYYDYFRVTQELQVKLDNFERSENSKKLEYAGNIVITAENYIRALNKDKNEDWKPQISWEAANLSYQYMQSCQSNNENCYNYNDRYTLDTKIAFDSLHQSLSKLQHIITDEFPATTNSIEAKK
jgi:hypothetical protein